VEVSGKSLPVLTNLDKGKYGVIVFENLNKYLQMDKWNRELLDKYCREYSVGIVGFNPPSEETLVGAQLRGFPLFIHTNLRLKVSLSGHLPGRTCHSVSDTTVFTCKFTAGSLLHQLYDFSATYGYDVMLYLGLYSCLTPRPLVCIWKPQMAATLLFHDKVSLSLNFQEINL
jgi:hypothetical protein